MGGGAEIISAEIDVSMMTQGEFEEFERASEAALRR
jgi:hypothetical protein